MTAPRRKAESEIDVDEPQKKRKKKKKAALGGEIPQPSTDSVNRFPYKHKNLYSIFRGRWQKKAMRHPVRLYPGFALAGTARVKSVPRRAVSAKKILNPCRAGKIFLKSVPRRAVPGKKPCRHGNFKLFNSKNTFK